MSKKSQKPVTHYVLVLDKSGSMSSTKTAAIEGFNELIQQVKEDSKTQDIFCYLVTFNGEVYEHLWGVPANQLEEASPADYIPNGATAMRDAVGYVVQKLLDTTDHENENNSYLVKVISDGETNSDRHYTSDVLKEILLGVQATKRWTISYIGCSEEYLRKIASQTGTPIANMASWSNASTASTKMSFKNMRAKQAEYFEARVKGVSGSATYASNNVGCVADFTKEDASAPKTFAVDQIDNISSGVALNAADLEVFRKSNCPAYTNATASYSGGSPLKDSMKVTWQNEPSPTFENRI